MNFHFVTTPRPALGSTQSPTQWTAGKKWIERETDDSTFIQCRGLVCFKSSDVHLWVLSHSDNFHDMITVRSFQKDRQLFPFFIHVWIYKSEFWWWSSLYVWIIAWECVSSCFDMWTVYCDVTSEYVDLRAALTPDGSCIYVCVVFLMFSRFMLCIYKFLQRSVVSPPASMTDWWIC